MTVFYIRWGATGTNRDDWAFVCDSEGNPLEYPDGKSAALALDALRDSEATRQAFQVPEGQSLCITREAETAGDDDWRAREAARFASGRYKPLPWATDENARMPEHHFAHVSENDIRKVAFTENEEKGRRDRQKVMNARDYLARFTGLSYEMQEYYSAIMLGLNCNLQFASTPDEIEAAYVKMSRQDDGGVSSCMTYQPSHFDSECHPVRVYGAGDLALAYLENENGDINARALVWPERKVCGRTYGYEAASLRAALRVQGYSNFDHDALTGARLLNIPQRGRTDCVVMPYIDGTHTFNRHSDGEHFVIAEDGFCAGNTNGLAYIYAQAECEHCNETFNADDATDVGGETWCPSCVDNYAFRCEHCEEMHHCDNGHEVITGRNRWGNATETWCEGCSDYHATYSEYHGELIASDIACECEHCSEQFMAGDLEETETADGETVNACEDCREAIADERAEAEAEAEVEADAPDAPEAEAAPLSLYAATPRPSGLYGPFLDDAPAPLYSAPLGVPLRPFPPVTAPVFAYWIERA